MIPIARAAARSPVLARAARGLSATAVRSADHQAAQDKAGDSTTTHFGFKTVPSDMKESLVRGVFSSVASSYDVMNDAMSMGVHRLWKDHFIRKMAPCPGAKLLDVAGGTGDIAQRFLEYQDRMNGDSSSSVHMIDINPEMLAEGERRFRESAWASEGRIAFTVGNAERLESIPDATFDVYSIAFGIRNCTRPEQVVREAFR
ncbi:2-hexaprenyl-6-methoxy-1,4-benzoquinone methyltransferase, partial [Coemansia sp. RSA 25]